MAADLILTLIQWGLIALLGVQALVFIGAILWALWTEALSPWLIPRSDITHAADDIIANYPDPEFEAFARQERAWFDSNVAEQVYWYRVRRAIRRQRS